MRSGADLYFERWSDPSFQQIGLQRTRGFITCEPDWYVTATSAGVGAWPRTKRPIRWWQRVDNSQVEIEVPNVKNLAWDKSIESDANTATITLANQWMRTNFAAALARELGIPGFFTFDHGLSPESQARWNHVANEWAGRLVPGALLRSYEGHGGYNEDGTSKTLDEMVADGDVFLTGVWQVDDVTIGARSKLIELKCRDMMALLIDQVIYPPLVPPGLYPLQYQRWVDTTVKIGYRPKHPSPAVFSVGGRVGVRYEHSSVDAWYGDNYSLLGHRGSHSVDGSNTSFALGEANSGPDKIFAVNYWQYTCGGQKVQAINVTPWKGGYEMYISVMENGRWLGAARVPYDHSPLIGNQPHVVDTHADIPYIKKVGVPGIDKPITVHLPRAYRADRIRISFRHLYNSPWPGIASYVTYRSGIREFKAYGVSTSSGANTRPYGWGALERHPIDGYWTLSYEGIVHPFGHAQQFGHRYGKDSQTYVDICATPTGLGYWLLNTRGEIFAFGDAVHYGDHEGVSSGAVAMARTHTGLGYWVVFRSGAIQNYGDAPPYSAVSLSTGNVIVDMAAMRDDYGIWVMDDDGEIVERGAAPNYGEPNDFADFDLNHAQGISTTPTEDGFVVTGFGGWVSGYGDLPSNDPYNVQRIGAMTAGYRPQEGIYIESIAVNGAGTGYWGLSTDGQIYTRGDAWRWGSPADGAATLRRDGNYKDYSDIVKDLLLWSGWFAKETVAAAGQPDVFGNIESTGIYSPEPLPPDMFDKQHPIDPIKKLREIVGYLTWVDDEGGFRFESPNWWSAGNWLDDGTHTRFIPEIDERIQLTDYTARISRSKDRSKIIISTDEPTAGFEDTITTEYTPSNSYLRGQVIPAMIRVPMNVTKEEQEIMAELIALHLWFARRAGNVTINPANPAIQINDQVRIWERVTSESYIHYVRAISNQHDFETGVWTQTLTTNWLGTSDGDWAITAEETGAPMGEEPRVEQFVISPRLIMFLEQLPKVRATLAAPEPIGTSSDVDAPDPGDNAAT